MAEQGAGGGRPGARREWLTIHEASDLIGVSSATLRRWSDAGEIRAFTTPGGHRRFARAAVLGLIPADRRERGASRLGDIGERIGRAYRKIGQRSSSAGIPEMRAATEGFLGRLGDPEREPFCELAGSMATALLELWDEGTVDGTAALGRAEAAAAAFGALAAARGASVAETIDSFLALRKPFIHELATGACRHGFDARQTTDLLETATEAIDHLFAALVRGHQAGHEQAASDLERVPLPDVAAAMGRSLPPDAGDSPLHDLGQGPVPSPAT